MDNHNWWSVFLYACISVLSILLSRAGLKSRIDKLEVEMQSLRDAHDTHKVDVENAMEQALIRFRSEVESQMKPVKQELADQSVVLGQISTMVSTLINRGRDESIIGDKASQGARQD